MAEYIKISDYCKLSVLSKSKVYRAINSGAIATKKIDGVQYVDIENLPEEYKLPARVTNTKKIIPQNTLIEVSRNSVPEIIEVDNKLPNSSTSTNSASIDLVKSFYENLEQRTKYTISMQEETINYYKSELNKRNDQIEFLMDLLKQKETVQNSVAVSSESAKDLTIAHLENKVNELSLKLNELNDANTSALAEKEIYEDDIPENETVLNYISSEYEDNTLELKDKLEESLSKISNFELKEHEYQAIIHKDAEEIKQLKQEILDKELSLKNLEMSKKELEESIETLSNASLETSNDLNTVKKELEFSIESLEKYKNKEKTVSLSLEDQSNKVIELENELNKRDLLLATLESSQNNLKSQIDDLLNESNNRKNIIESLEHKLNESSEQLIMLNKTNKSLEVKIQETEELVKGYENDKLLEGDDEQIEALEEELFDKEHQISELELELCIKEDNINFYKNEVEQLKEKISSLEQFANDQQNPFNDKDVSVNNDLCDLQSQLSEKENHIKSLTWEKEHADFLISNLEKDLEFYKKLDLSGENLSIDTQQRLSWLLNEADERQKIIIKQDMIIKERNNIIKEKDIVLKERQDRILDLEKFLAKGQNIQETLEKELEDLREVNAQFSGKINPDVQNNLENEIVRLKSIIDDKDALIEQLQKNMQNLESINNKLHNKVNPAVDDPMYSTKELNNKLNELFDQITEKDKQISELILEIKDKDEIIVSLQAGPEKQLISFDDDSEYEDQDLISSLEEQINNLLEENADKDQQIEYLQSVINVNGEAGSINLEEELNELKSLLAQKEEELKTERQKFINCAVSKSPQSIQILNMLPNNKESHAGSGVTDNLHQSDETILNEEPIDKTEEL